MVIYASTKKLVHYIKYAAYVPFHLSNDLLGFSHIYF